jgi:hypothetical protein
MEDCQKKSGVMTRIMVCVSTHFALILAIFTLGLAVTGCSTYDETNPSRSASEQLLISTAMDRALTNEDLSIFSGRKIYLDATYFASYDQQYALGEIRDALNSAGALLVDNVTNSDLVVEPRSGALSVDASSSLVGIPAMGLPVPLSGALSTPEIAFYKSVKQNSIGKIALLAYDTKSRRHYYSSGPLLGKSYNYYRKILFISWISTDIPEKQKNEKKREKYSTEFSTPPPASTEPTPIGPASQ